MNLIGKIARPNRRATADAITRDCRSDHPAFHASGERLLSTIRYAVVHCTATEASAESIAAYFMRPDSGGSAHAVVDDLRCYRTLGDNVIPWAAPPLNTHGWHLEIVGRASRSARDWHAHEASLRRGAYKMAKRMRWYGIPLRLLDRDALRADFGYPLSDHGGVPQHPGPLYGGVVSHATISAAFGLSDHSDPGPFFPWNAYMDLLRAYLPADWNPHPGRRVSR